LKMARVCAPLGAVFAVSDSNGKPAEGSELSCSPAFARGAAAPENAAAGSSKHISRRVIVIVTSSLESAALQKFLDSGQENLLASLRLSSRKPQTKNKEKLHDGPQPACDTVR
jgi:hypothetical protein